MNRTLCIASCVMAFLSLSACGQKTESGVKFEAKSPSELQKMCRSSLSFTADLIGSRLNVGKGQQKRMVNRCCKHVKKDASKLSKAQRAYTWYSYASENDLELTPNQINQLSTVRNALRADLNTADYTAAVRPKTKAGVCIGQAFQEIERKQRGY